MPDIITKWFIGSFTQLGGNFEFFKILKMWGLIFQTIFNILQKKIALKMSSIP